MNFLRTKRFVLTLLTLTAVSLACFTTLQADPLKEIKVTARIKMTAEEGKILVTKANIFRLTITDPSICQATVLSPREISIIARHKGVTNVTFWMEGLEATPSKLEVTVMEKKKKKKK